MSTSSPGPIYETDVEKRRKYPWLQRKLGLFNPSGAWADAESVAGTILLVLIADFFVVLAVWRDDAASQEQEVADAVGSVDGLVESVAAVVRLLGSIPVPFILGVLAVLATRSLRPLWPFLLVWPVWLLIDLVTEGPLRGSFPARDAFIAMASTVLFTRLQESWLRRWLGIFVAFTVSASALFLSGVSLLDAVGGTLFGIPVGLLLADVFYHRFGALIQLATGWEVSRNDPSSGESKGRRPPVPRSRPDFHTTTSGGALVYSTGTDPEAARLREGQEPG